MSDKDTNWVMTDGNEAAAWVAYNVSEVCAIYPITPSSTMAELADEWSAKQLPNIWDNVPSIVEMQHEGGAAGAVHGALQAGALSTTFTASQGLMLMLPNMYKIAGELTATVFHVAARSLAAQGLSIFGDHQDVMAARTTGFAMLSAASVQQAQDMAMIAHAATLSSRIPFIHFFDGFRTSHEVNKISRLPREHIRAMISGQLVREHRERALNPDRPVMRGTAQNPDTYFQGRESVNAFYDRVPAIVEQTMEKFAELTGRRYQLVDYYGAEKAEHVIVIMGSGAATVRLTIDALNAKGGKYGLMTVHLYRPFPTDCFIKTLPASVKFVTVLDRTKEPGANGEPLYLDTLAALVSALQHRQLKKLPRLSGGRYGLSSKEFTPAMVKAVFEQQQRPNARPFFTIGINDDVTHLSLDWDENWHIEPDNQVRALFFGLGADGTVGANKNSIKIIGELPNYYAQGYFVYDSKKSGSRTTSHLRFGPEPIDAPYLIGSANFIGCHQFNFIETLDVLSFAAPGATFLLNSPWPATETWHHLPAKVQQKIQQKKLSFYVINAAKVAQQSGMGSRINTIMQTCFFALSNVMPKERAIKLIKKSIEKTYSRKGRAVIDKNFAAVDASLANLHQIKVPEQITGATRVSWFIPEEAPRFVRDVTAEMLQDRGDRIPVSLLPADGTYPTATTQWEKRDIALTIPDWREDLCIQCGNCSFVCPHAAIRAKFYHRDRAEGAPESVKSAPISARGFPDTRYTLQVYPQDCTGCNLCVDACPVRATDAQGNTIRAINMVDKLPILERSKASLNWFQAQPWPERSTIDFSTVRGVQYLEPLFEFSGACSGCGETPYLKLLTQLFGDRMMVANATGCSSIYGGNLPTTPWAKNHDGKGPAWSNSLFEDNAEFGLGFRLTADQHKHQAIQALRTFIPLLGQTLVDEIINAPQQIESDIYRQRQRLAKVRTLLADDTSEQALNLQSMLDHLIRRSIWIVGGDGWAYDIGSAGLDHALASGRDINILVMDTEVYSNTGGQMSKSTPLGATARFAAGGKTMAKKDIALQAISYGNVYVARIAFGASPQQTLQAIREAEAYPGPSLIIAYSHCIAHGIDMKLALQQQKRAVQSGHWPLFRYNPVLREGEHNPFSLDSLRPTLPLSEYRKHETRFLALMQQNPQEAERLMNIAQNVAWQKWATYENMATRPASAFHPDARR
ncbi:pyruvate:ferredoxin (flavodoxin) oxidoreductase [Mixta intestinalis]|uniref:Pyruvate-flavodoxin oxidoreductase n=1 Tax=Mixta intestinalis TaxID=1615494 RepID=A0A6P1PVE1_9GAMM|nr:pyruvate:ferredoxin (flavodoxin) oxidoreductase [Mixta intestinalis]QHM70014.1 Pyruvate-flavodoxin oxidoreductase [Mixta intestinalis]